MAKDATERAIGTAESIKSNGGAKKRRRFATTDTLEQEHCNTVFLQNHFIDRDDMNSIKQTPSTDNNALFSMIAGNNSVNAAYGANGETLEDTLGWLETFAIPGKEETCVVFGHRNRKRLKILKNVQLEETIKIKSIRSNISYFPCNQLCGNLLQ